MISCTDEGEAFGIKLVQDFLLVAEFLCSTGLKLSCFRRLTRVQNSHLWPHLLLSRTLRLKTSPANQDQYEELLHVVETTILWMFALELSLREGPPLAGTNS